MIFDSGLKDENRLVLFSSAQKLKILNKLEIFPLMVLLKVHLEFLSVNYHPYIFLL
jgi:hypothetical protein